jgi:hypothetical protein
MREEVGMQLVAAAIIRILRVLPAALALCTAVATSAGAQAVGVVSPAPPNDAEIAGDTLYHFVVHHASTHYPASVGAVSGGLLRWRGGRAETVCPATEGLDPAFNDFVSARVLAVAAFVGAPVHTAGSCVPNVQILFTTDPRKSMAYVLHWGAKSLGVGFPHQMEKELDLSGTHPIQGWYITAGGGSSVLNRDAALVGGIDLQSLWPLVVPTGSGVADRGRSILSVVIIIDANKVAGMPIGSIADYVAMLSLTVIQTPDHCDALPSILDIMSTSCGSREKPAGITSGDLAFLKALYYHNTGLGPTLSRDDMVINMMKQFRGG